jgi:phosphoserine phosphatase
MTSNMTSTVLITLTGRDRPGVTAALTAALSECDVTITDIEQIVIRGRLTLGLLLSPTETSDDQTLATAERVARSIADDLGLDIDVLVTTAVTGDRDLTSRARLLVTVLGLPLRPAGVSAISSRILSSGGNIDRIRRVASYPVTAIEFEVTGAD